MKRKTIRKLTKGIYVYISESNYQHDKGILTIGLGKNKADMEFGFAKRVLYKRH